MKSINHKKLKELIKIGYEKQIPLFIWGAIGIGKSTAVKEMCKGIAKEQKLEFCEDYDKDKFSFIDVRVSQLEPSDLRGLPSMDNGITKWLPPSWLPQDENSKGVLFFDELNLAVPSIQASAYQLILDRRLGDYKLPKGWVIISAGNRLEDKARVFELPSPLANRFIHIELSVPDKDEWFKWATENNIDSRVMAFIQFKPSMLFKFETDNKDKAFATPRSWEFCSKLINGAEKDDDLNILVSSAVGEGTALEFIAFNKLQRKIDIKDILKNPKKIAEIKELDLKYSVISCLIEEYKKDKKKLESITNLCEFLEPEFSILILRFMKGSNPTHFKQNIIKCKNWNSLSEKYLKYLKD
ncbi:MAG: AAA family ATPase [Candidatus Nanoarchaeia archaeon]